MHHNLIDWAEAQKEYFDEMEMHETLGWRCGLLSFPKYITKSKAVAAYIAYAIDNDGGYDPPDMMSYSAQWKYWAKEGNRLRKQALLLQSKKGVSNYWVATDTWREDEFGRIDRDANIAVEKTALDALNAVLKYAEDWEEAAGGNIYIYHQGFEMNPIDICDYLILCYLKDRDPALAEALQTSDGEIVYGCAPSGVHCNSDMESALELFQYLTGEDWCGRHYSANRPMPYPQRPRLEELVWVNEGEETDDDCSNG